MAEGFIPVNPGDLPIDTVPMQEDSVYTGTLKQALINPKLSKKDVPFCMIQLEVSEGDYEGRVVNANYVPLPVAVTPDLSKSQRIIAMDRSTTFGRFVASFRITGSIPTISLTNPEKIVQSQEMRQEWQEWISKFYGNQGKFTIRNQEFPEGSGRQRSGINDFVV